MFLCGRGRWCPAVLTSPELSLSWNPWTQNCENSENKRFNGFTKKLRYLLSKKNKIKLIPVLPGSISKFLFHTQRFKIMPFSTHLSCSTVYIPLYEHKIKTRFTDNNISWLTGWCTIENKVAEPKSGSTHRRRIQIRIHRTAIEFESNPGCGTLVCRSCYFLL